MKSPTVLIVLVLLGACAQFDPIEPPADEPPDDLSRPVVTLPDREVFVYDGTWKGLSAGQGTFRFEREGEVVTGEAHLETSGLVALLYGVDVRATGTVGADDLVSRSFSWSTGDGDEVEKQVEVRFVPGTDRIVSVVRKEDGGVDQVQRELAGAREPLGLILALRRADLTPGGRFRTHLFTEWNPYQVDGEVLGDETVEVDAGEFRARQVRVDLRKLVDGKPEEEPQSVAVWITPDERRLLVRIDLDTRMGRIRLELLPRE